MYRGCGRNPIAVYPRGILERAWVEIIEELGDTAPSVGGVGPAGLAIPAA
jgi:hypothetical protein